MAERRDLLADLSSSISQVVFCLLVVGLGDEKKLFLTTIVNKLFIFDKKFASNKFGDKNIFDNKNCGKQML